MKMMLGLTFGMFVMLLPATGHAVVNTWIGGGADNNASTTDNWSEGVPQSDHHIVVEGGPPYLLGDGELIRATYRYDTGTFSHNELIYTGNGIDQSFAGTLANTNIWVNTVVISINNGDFFLRDNGSGALIDAGEGSYGSGTSGTIDYETGDWTIDATQGNLSKHITWNAGVNDLSATVASWTQTADYSGTVMIETRYPDLGGFTNLTITGDCVISNGVYLSALGNGGRQGA